LLESRLEIGLAAVRVAAVALQLPDVVTCAKYRAVARDYDGSNGGGGRNIIKLGLEEALNMANLIASKSLPVMAMGKQAFYEQFDPDLAKSYDRATRAMVENMMLEDAREGLGAFLEKRAPNWRDA